ncbi:hypothetical protein AAVH_28075 [Aphelenchoides avenae]|nr:hypothetical protein AAVH_28075 [Aphelenchus avenae]
MLASLSSRNCSVGDMDLHAESERLSDHRSMGVVFRGMRMSDLGLSCGEHSFVELVETTDFFRMSTVQGLRRLTLNLDAQEPGGHARSMNPLWVSGIHLLRNCELYRVHHWPNSPPSDHLRSIEREIVEICEAFERGEITSTVEHFEYKPPVSTALNCAFSRDNLVASGMKVEGTARWTPINDFEWDVYRFRNSSSNEYLTACVGQKTSRIRGIDLIESVLHILKGEVYPNASFAVR